MSKHIASKDQRILHLEVILFCLIAGIGLIILYVKNLVQNKTIFDVWTVFFLSIAPLCALIGAVGYIYRFIDDPILGKFSFDNKIITFYLPNHKIVFLYEECKEMGITLWPGPRGSLIYVYLSKVELTDRQKNRLFGYRNKKGKKDMPIYQSDYLLFQYTPEIFCEFIDCVPSPFREALLKEERELGLKEIE